MAIRSFCPQCKGGTANVRIVVHEERIMAAFTDRGMLAPEMRELKDLHVKLAKMLSPVRTGRMRNNHVGTMLPAKGFGRSYSVGTRARYAHFVIGGTAQNGTGYIYPKGEELELRPIPYSYFIPSAPGRFRDRVKGQRRWQDIHAMPNHWLAMAGSEAMAYFGLGTSRFSNAVSRPKG